MNITKKALFSGILLLVGASFMPPIQAREGLITLELPTGFEKKQMTVPISARMTVGMVLKEVTKKYGHHLNPNNYEEFALIEKAKGSRKSNIVFRDYVFTNKDIKESKDNLTFQVIIVEWAKK